jgi:DNA helicase-2/ATP-dependent DNA helicase PcrA
MKLTDKQRQAVKLDVNTLLVACPGSGKTRVILAKLLRTIEEVRGTARRIACIAYTNAAVDEIDSRLRVYGRQDDENFCDISTIHTFCLQNILKHFHWRLDCYSKDVRVLGPDQAKFKEFVEETCVKFQLPYRAKERFENLSRNTNGDLGPMEDFPPEAAKYFWQLLENECLIDFGSILYWTYHLLVKYPSIASAVSSRFVWILVDEFQDTSPLQFEILKLLYAQNRSRFFLVGDPHQAIFSFAGADVELMGEFAEVIGANQDIELTQNWRSSQSIVNQAEKVFPRELPMEAVGENSEFPHVPQHFVCSGIGELIVSEFLTVARALEIPFGKCAVLAPAWHQLIYLARELRQNGIPVVGPGARPYKKRHVIAPLAEQIGAYIENRNSERIPQIERELFWLQANSPGGGGDLKVFSYEGRVVVFRLINRALEIMGQTQNASGWLLQIAKEFGPILSKAGVILESAEGNLVASAEAMLQEIQGNKIDLDSLKIRDLGMFADAESNLKLLTIHGAKGREFEAVALIHLNDGNLPNSRHLEGPGLEDQKRMLYVAITRAQKMLMYVTHESWKYPPSRFLSILYPDEWGA